MNYFRYGSCVLVGLISCGKGIGSVESWSREGGGGEINSLLFVFELFRTRPSSVKKKKNECDYGVW